MRVLLVGAGAVGQAYGSHFQRGGAEVVFLVRDRYAAATRRGFDLYPLNERKRSSGPVRFEGFQVLTTLAEVEAEHVDLVVLCVSSTALRRGTWFSELVDVIGEAAVLCLTPGLEDNAFVLEHVPEPRAVFGLIGLLSYPGPLPGEALPSPGMVYWVPPLTKMTFSGAQAPTRAVVETLNRGGLASKQVVDTAVDSAFMAPVLQMHMVALELAGWSFVTLRRDKALMRTTHRAMRQAFTVAGARVEAKPPMGLRMLRPWIMRIVLALMPVLAPVDMEQFFRVHFTKVADQTMDNLASYARLGGELPGELDAIDDLRERLTQARS